MKVYAPPANVRVPDFDEAFVDGRYSMEKDNEVHERFFNDLAGELRDSGYAGPLTGEIVRFPIADGYAQYMVADAPRATCLIHLPIHDAWSISDAHARGLRKKDITDMVARDKRIAELFARKD